MGTVKCSTQFSEYTVDSLCTLLSLFCLCLQTHGMSLHQSVNLWQGWDPRSGPRRNSKDSDFLSVLFKIIKKESAQQRWVILQVLANPVNIRRSSAPPVQTRQRSLSSIKVPLPFLSFKLFTFSFSFDPRTTRTATTTWPRYLSGRAGGSLSRRRTPFSSWNSSSRMKCGNRTTTESYF